MAEFLLALIPILHLEGRIWSYAPTDKGRETYCGISRVYWPNHPIWIRVDLAKRALPSYTPKSLSEYLEKDEEAQRLVKQFYSDWWHRMRLSEVKSQKVAFFLFQASVNFGEEKVARWAQMICITNGKSVAVDGKIGPVTLAAINAICEANYLRDAAVMQRYHYLMAIVDDKNQIANKDGWEERVWASL